MEGVVLVETSSGALHYTRSFSDAFDTRHPKAERLNLSALIFALQNFAGSSIRSTEKSVAAGIVMFSTPLENMVISTTPSRKLLLVLFTIPDFDVEIAKWLVTRLALKYDICGNAEMQRINTVPRLFRQAFTQAIEEVVEQELIRLSESIFFFGDKQISASIDTSSDQDAFLFFICLSCSRDIKSKSYESKTLQADRADECRHAVSTDLTLLDVPKDRMRKFRISRVLNMGTVIPAIATSSGCWHPRKPNAKKKTRWGSRNTVTNYLEPHKFQRVFQIHFKEKKVALYQGEVDRNFETGTFSFANLSLLSSKVVRLEPQQHLQNLDQIVLMSSTALEKQREQSTLVAWRSGSCCMYYPIAPAKLKSETDSRVRLAVTAVFETVELLFNAQTKILV